MYNIMIVDDEENIVSFIQESLKLEGLRPLSHIMGVKLWKK